MDAAHWNEAYDRLGARGVSWHRSHEAMSLDLISRLPDPPRSVIDVGGGASHLVGALAGMGIDDLTVLDISAVALQASQRENALGPDDATWITTDVRSWAPDRTWDLWHDRAVFHFMVDDADRAAYRRALAAGLSPGGHVIAATFAPDGPEQCSRLPVRRYAPGELVTALGDDLRLVAHEREVHVTPSGNEQPFTWVLAMRLH